MSELADVLDKILQESEDYQRGFRDGLRHFSKTESGPETKETEESEEENQAQEASEVNIEERYPLDRSTLREFNDRRLEYELVILFNSKKNEANMDTFEVMEAIWNWGDIDSQQYEYKRVQKTMEDSNMFASKNTRPKRYFLRPGREREVPEEVIQ